MRFHAATLRQGVTLGSVVRTDLLSWHEDRTWVGVEPGNYISMFRLVVYRMAEVGCEK